MPPIARCPRYARAAVPVDLALKDGNESDAIVSESFLSKGRFDGVEAAETRKVVTQYHLEAAPCRVSKKPCELGSLLNVFASAFPFIKVLPDDLVTRPKSGKQFFTLLFGASLLIQRGHANVKYGF